MAVTVDTMVGLQLSVSHLVLILFPSPGVVVAAAAVVLCLLQLRGCRVCVR